MTALTGDPATDPPSDPSSDPPFDGTARLMLRATIQLAARRLARTRIPSRDLLPDPWTTAPPLVAVAHGSRDPAAARTAEALLDLVRALRPGLSVRLGHIELSQPLLGDTLASMGAGEAVLVPLLLSRGHHVKSDIPDGLARAPHLSGRIAAPLGPHPLLAEALHARLVEAGWPQGKAGPTDAPRPDGADGPAGPDRRAVILAAAGSRDPESALDTGRTAALLSARLGVPVVPAYASARRPTVPDAVAELTARGYGDIAVASYFAAPGRFSAQCAGQSPTVASAPMGAHPALARLVLARYDQALAGTATRAGAARADAAAPATPLAAVR